MKSSANSARIGQPAAAPERAERFVSAPTTALSPASVDFVRGRTRKAHAIALLAKRIFASADRCVEADGQALLSLEHAGRLLHESIKHLEEIPSGPKGLCETDPWWVNLLESQGLTDTLQTATWIGGSVADFSSEVGASYVAAIEDSILRALEGLRSACAEVAHG